MSSSISGFDRSMGSRRRLPQRRLHNWWTLSMPAIATRPASASSTRASSREIFINVPGRSGSAIEAVARDAAILTSICLQHGASMDTIRHALTRNSDGSAGGPLGVVLDLLASGVGSSKKLLRILQRNSSQSFEVVRATDRSRFRVELSGWSVLCARTPGTMQMSISDIDDEMQNSLVSAACEGRLLCPPEHSQFKPGQSGNPERPRQGKPELQDALQQDPERRDFAPRGIGRQEALQGRGDRAGGRGRRPEG